MEWISVNDKLPDNSGEFLVYGKDGKIGIYYFDKNEGFLHYFTHWMDLPKAPKDGDNDI